MRALVSLLASLLIRLLRSTWRVSLSGLLPTGEAPRVFCFWHGRQAGLFAHPRQRSVAVLSSLSRDGDVQARVLTRLGFTVLRGSSSRGGAAGLKGLVAALRDGADAAFAVDGPRGPLHRVKKGALVAARLAGATIVPVSARASRSWIFEKAWDRYLLPKPFARVEIVRGEGIEAPADSSIEDLRARLEAALHALDVP
ncbi:MAG: lysophospholipid acyltransferase family protein [Deltaproteobacteria bacterium]|nr:lysophospholipid acyltransferase family protein [Deltaproteobacteria bacterium]